MSAFTQQAFARLLIQYRCPSCTSGVGTLVVSSHSKVRGFDPATGEKLWECAGVPDYVVPAVVADNKGVVYITGGRTPTTLAIRAGGRGDVTDTHVVWKSSRQIPKRSSPLLVGRQVYLVSDTGVATCFDASTGETHWCQRIGGNYSASPIYADRRIYFFSQEGQATVLRPGTTFHKLAENRIDGRLMATPAIAAGSMFLRTDTHLYRIE